MKNLDYNEYKTCQFLASLFEESIDSANFSSPMFIRRFMMSDQALYFENKSILIITLSRLDIIEELNSKYKSSTKSPMYSKNQMYWIGYIYACISFLYKLSFKSLYKLFPSKEIVKYYNIYHTFGIEDAAERMMENIGYKDEDLTTKGVIILKRLILLDNLISLIGKQVTVYIDRPIGSHHPKYKDTIYSVNYGHIKEYKALDGDYQDAYVIGVSKPLEIFEGVVIAVVKRTNDNADKLVVAKENTSYSIDEIEKSIAFQEKYFKHKLILK